MSEKLEYLSEHLEYQMQTELNKIKSYFIKSKMCLRSWVDQGLEKERMSWAVYDSTVNLVCNLVFRQILQGIQGPTASNL
jgi:hypothetical protein